MTGLFPMHSDSPVKIAVITTGGTIEKTYNETSGGLTNESSNLESVIRPQLRLPYTDLTFIRLLNMDSLLLTDNERRIISDCVKSQLKNFSSVVVVHGTDTVDQTLAFVTKAVANPRGTVVFTGAIRPITLFQSDARQNFCEALLASKLLPPGFYLSFHNHIYRPGEFRKIPEKGTFVNL